MAQETIRFTGAGGDELSARLTRPAGPTRTCALFAHCFTCSKDLHAVRRLVEALALQGVATLSFDFTGLGQSEGDFAETTFSSNVDDLVAAAEFMASRGESPSLLIGHSLGGAAALVAAPRIESVRAVATIAAPADPAHVRKLFASDEVKIRQEGEAVVSLAGRPFRIKQAFLDDLETQASGDAISRLGRALLVLHSPTDNLVGIENAKQIYEAARHPKSFIALDGADHLLTRPEDAEFVAGVVSAWASRYLPAYPATEDPDATHAVVTRVRGEDSLRQDIFARHHHWVADEPEGVGGEDLGPTPYELLLASLGACTSMTLRMYALRKKWPLQAVDVAMTHERIHAKDCDECESESGYVDQIHREITIEGPLDETQRARLMEIADRCPVHRTLHNEIRVISRLRG